MASKSSKALAVFVLLFIFLYPIHVTVAEDMPLSLSQAIHMAFQADYGLKATTYDTLAVANQVRQAGSAKYPTLSLNAKARFVDEVPSINSPLFSIELGSKNTYLADLTLSMPIYTGGKISTQISMARENQLAARYGFQAKKMEAAFRCRQAYFNLMVAQALVHATESSLKRLQLIKKDVENLYASGMADSLDILETELAYETGNRALTDVRTAYKNASDALLVLLGMQMTDTVIVPSENLSPPQKPTMSEREIISKIRRPELSRLAHVASAAEKAAANKRADYFPNIIGFAGYSYGKPNQDLFNKTWNDYMSAGVTLTWDFNMGKKTAHAIQAANAVALSAKMQRQNLEDSFILAGRVALNNVNKTYSQYEISRRERDIAQRKFNLAQQKQKEGHLSINRLLEVEADLASAEKRFEASLISFYAAQNNYLYAIGSEELYGGVQ